MMFGKKRNNEILRKSHELEKLFAKLAETKAQGKAEKNENMKQFIANEYIQIENKIKMSTIQLKDLQKTYILNLNIMSKEELLKTYSVIDKYKIASNNDLISIVEKITNIQKDKIVEEKEREDIEEVFVESIDSYSEELDNPRASELINAWAKEVTQEEFEKESNPENLAVVAESKGEM